MNVPTLLQHTPSVPSGVHCFFDSSLHCSQNLWIEIVFRLLGFNKYHLLQIYTIMLECTFIYVSLHKLILNLKPRFDMHAQETDQFLPA